MTTKFFEITLCDDSKIVVNRDYLAMVSPTHGSKIENGAEAFLVVFGEQGAVNVSIPASEVPSLLAAIKPSAENQFLDLVTTDGSRLIVNAAYMSHIEAIHGNDFSNGAMASVFGVQIQLPATSAIQLMKDIGI